MKVPHRWSYTASEMPPLQTQSLDPMWIMVLQLSSAYGVAPPPAGTEPASLHAAHCGARSPTVHALCDSPEQGAVTRMRGACCSHLMLLLQDVRCHPLLACRGDAAPSTSTEKSKAASDMSCGQAQQEASLAHARLPQRSAAPIQMPFPFQHLPSRRAGASTAEQLTPVLPDKQRLIACRGRVRQLTCPHCNGGRWASQSTCKCWTSTACSQLRTSAAEGLRSVQHRPLSTAAQA